jgi:fatty acid desaturase
MEPFLIIIGILLSLLFVLCGYLVKYKKKYFLISGYNLMGKEEKRKVDVVKISCLMFNYMLIIGLLVLFATIFYAFSILVIAKIMLLLLIPMVLVMLVHLQKYDGNNFKDGKLKSSTIIILFVLALIFIFAEISFAYLLFSL